MGTHRSKALSTMARALGYLGALLLGVGLGSCLAADKYPNHAIEMIVPYPPGGSADIVSRLFAKQMESDLGVPIAVMNRAGAAGQIGWTALARAKPDGYSIGLVTASLMHLPALNDSLPFDVSKDFAYISRVVEMPFVMTSSAKYPWRNASDVIEFAKKKPGELAYGSYGIGSSPHILGAMLAREAGVQLNHVSFKGASEMVQLQITGEVPVAFDLVITQLPHIKSSTLTPLFVTSAKRLDSLPDTPTAAEAGLPALEFSTWFGFAAPRGTPSDVVDALSRAIGTAAQNAEMVSKLQQGGMVPMSESPAAFRNFATDYKERIRKVLAGERTKSN